MAVGIWCGVLFAVLGWFGAFLAPARGVRIDFWSVMSLPGLFLAAAAWEGVLALHWKERYLRLRGPAAGAPAP